MTENQMIPVGCLVVDDPMSGENWLSGLSLPAGLRACPFDWRAGEGLLSSLQTLLQRVRSECGAASILARGLGCAAALALAEQLPVERLALVEPTLRPVRTPKAIAKPLNRIARYAARNLSLCVSGTLIAARADDRDARIIARALWANCRVFRVNIPGETVPEMETICENGLKRAITDFLRGEELSKDLAQNPEMCIIYG